MMIFPDINVWLALSFTDHAYSRAAQRWFEDLPAGHRLWFCRVTQMGLLRLLNREAVMGRGVALSQAAAWRIYDRWLSSPVVDFMAEPHGLDLAFRRAAAAATPMPQRFADDYLMAFAQAAEFHLATFDRALSRRAEGAILIA